MGSLDPDVAMPRGGADRVAGQTWRAKRDRPLQRRLL